MSGVSYIDDLLVLRMKIFIVNTLNIAYKLAEL